MQTTFTIAALIATASAINLGAEVSAEDSQDFLAYLAEHSKSYDNQAEFNIRQAAFLATDKWLKLANGQPGELATYAHNFLSDMNDEEKKAMTGGSGMPQSDSDDEESGSDAEESGADDTQAASSAVQRNLKKEANSTSSGGIDWRALGAVTPVKNQANCGSCWAFSSVAQLEGLYQIATGTLENMSEQNVVDCSLSGNGGCNGGSMWNVYSSYTNTKGLMKTSDYPYMAVNQPCAYKPSEALEFWTSNSQSIHTWNSDDWKARLDVGPLSMSLSAGNPYFENYYRGILTTTKCTNSPDHSVTMVGWGVDSDSGIEYWIVKNSWSTGWGDNGYIRIATSPSGVGICSVQSNAFPVDFNLGSP